MAATGGTSGADRSRIASCAHEREPGAPDAPGRVIDRSVGPTIVIGTAIVLLALIVPAFATPIGMRPETLVIIIGLAPLIGAAAVDLRHRRLPDRLLGPAGLVVAVAVVHPMLDISATAVASGAVIGGGSLLALHLVSPASLGFGDVKAAATGGGLIGIVEPLAVPVVLAVAAVLTAMAAIVLRRRSLPFGPGLVIGVIVAVGISGVDLR